MQSVVITGEMIMKLCQAYDSLDKEESNAASFGNGMKHALAIVGIFVEDLNTDLMEVMNNVEDNEASRG